MKYLLIIALVLVVFWLWRQNRQNAKKAASPRANVPPVASATEMVACDLCHVHLPKSDALIGREGFYCSEAHRREAGD
ncbi:MAG: hypothetical protein JWR68_1205 [Polaromonas sp.]|nr:hypothetical protein [Polaromonas sp.]